MLACWVNFSGGLVTAKFRALRLAPVGAVAPFHYTELVWAAVLGWVFWNEWPEAHVGWGAAVIVGAGLYTVWREQRASRVRRHDGQAMS